MTALSEIVGGQLGSLHGYSALQQAAQQYPAPQTTQQQTTQQLGSTKPMTPTDFNAQNAAEAARACDKLNSLLADLEQCGCLVSISDGERLDRVQLGIEFPVRPR